MRPRPPNYYFPDTSFAGIRRRLLRLASDLSQFTTPDSLYEEILDSFTSLGVERRTSRGHSIPEFPWSSFIPDVDAEVFTRKPAFLSFLSCYDPSLEVRSI
jgi:hypothetical protein